MRTCVLASIHIAAALAQNSFIRLFKKSFLKCKLQLIATSRLVRVQIHQSIEARIATASQQQGTHVDEVMCSLPVGTEHICALLEIIITLFKPGVMGRVAAAVTLKAAVAKTTTHYGHYRKKQQQRRCHYGRG